MKQRPSLATLVATLFLVAPAVAMAQIPHEESGFTSPIVDNRDTPWVDVLANKYAWQSSGVLVQEGDTYLITASGKWQVAGSCPLVGPDGAGTYNLVCWDIGGQVLPGYSHAALIGKVGRDGQPFYVGSNHRLTPQTTDVLYLMANDNPAWFGDNTGTVKVVVNMLSRAPQQQAPVMQPVMPVMPVMPVLPQPGQVLRGGGGGGRAPQPQ